MTAMTLAPGRNGARLLPPTWAMLAGLLVTLPALTGFGAWRYMAWVHDYYTGDMPGIASHLSFRNRAGALIERASFLQSRIVGPIDYAWDAALGTEPRRYLRTAAGVADLEPIRLRNATRDMAAGIVENDLGVIVVAVSTRDGSSCRGLLYWMSPFTKGRARAAWLPGREGSTLPGGKEIASASWKPAPEVMDACVGEGPYGALLLRFDPG